VVELIEVATKTTILMKNKKLPFFLQLGIFRRISLQAFPLVEIFCGRRVGMENLIFGGMQLRMPATEEIIKNGNNLRMLLVYQYLFITM
jgi:hypothetical protein